MRGLAAALVAAGALSWAAPAAHAAEVASDFGGVRFAAAAGEVNRLAVALEGRVFSFRDDGASFRASGACGVDDARTARCITFSEPDAVSVALGDGADLFTTTAGVRALVQGGDGDDLLAGGRGADVLAGDSGADTLAGGAGPDRLSGGAGDDSIDSRDGERDEVECGAGADSVASDPVDLLAPDCEPPERVVVPPPLPNPEPRRGGGGRTACASADAVPSAASAGRLARSALCLVNQERRRRGLRALRADTRLRVAARGHARDMVARSYFAHRSLGGRSVVDRLRRAGYLRGRHTFIGETLAWGSGPRGTPRAIVAAWMASPGHRAVLLSRRYREIGLAAVPGSPRSRSGSAATYAADLAGPAR